MLRCFSFSVKAQIFLRIFTFMHLHDTSAAALMLHIKDVIPTCLAGSLSVKKTDNLVCRDINSHNAIRIAVLSPFTNYQATWSNTLSWTPETSAIDLLMRNVERIGDT